MFKVVKICALGLLLFSLPSLTSARILTKTGRLQAASDQPIHFRSPTKTDWLITTTEQQGQKKSYVSGIVDFDAKTKKVSQVLYSEAYPFTKPRFAVGKLFKDGTEQAIIGYSEGSGSYLSYKVIAYKNHQAKVILERKGIFSGFCAIEDHKIHETSGHQDTFFTWNGSGFTETKSPVEVMAPVQPNETRITYTIAPNHFVSVSQKNVTLHIGQALSVRRMNTGVVERVMTSGNFWNYTQNGMKAIKTGTTDVTIVPDGYDWNNAAKINVTIVP